MVLLAKPKKWRSGQRKLSNEDIKGIRQYARRKKKAHGWKSGLARMYKVSPGHITDILSGRRRA